MTDLEKSTGFLVVRTARSMKRALDSRLAPIGVTAAQHVIISTLAHEDGLSLSEVGKRAYLDKPAITGLADRLEKDRLVERRRSTNDRRVVKLHLTRKGRNLLQEMDRIATEVDRELVGILSGVELRRLRELVTRLWVHSNGEPR